jgi:hypothetical protein
MIVENSRGGRSGHRGTEGTEIRQLRAGTMRQDAEVEILRRERRSSE